jgi:tetratricopeptide (TPR) repeat protein
VTRRSAFACLIGPLFAVLGVAQAAQSSSSAPTEKAPQQAAPPASSDIPDIDPDQLPEEDESLKPKTYPFNPLEAERNLKVGEFYMKQHTPSGFRAAAGRFEDATKYNPNSPEAFLKLGEAQEKLKHTDKAKAAFEKAIKLAAPESKIARDARKRIASLS